MACRPECTTVHNILQHWSTLDIYSRPHPFKLSGIICTIGPSTNDPDKIAKMIEAGMNVARVSPWQNSQEKFEEIINVINHACEKLSNDTGIQRVIGIGIDTQGHEIRIGDFEDESGTQAFEIGSKVTIIGSGEEGDAIKSSNTKLNINIPDLAKYVKEGTKIFLDYGAIGLTVCTAEENSVTCKIDNSGVARNQANLNVPGVEFDLPALSEKDICRIKYGIEHNVDIIFASMVRGAGDIKEIRQILGDLGNQALILAKIENRQGLVNLDEIIKEADGIIVGRGDLGVEIPPQKIAVAQKMIIARCNKFGKPAIVASQMLESMITKPRPSRAELADVVNIILDGASSILLNFETAHGKYPIECISIASNICREAETALWLKEVHNDLCFMVDTPMNVGLADSAATVVTASMVCASAIIVMTTTGKSAYNIARFKPCCPIIAVTRNIRVARQASLYRAVVPVLYKEELLPDWRKDLKVRVEFGIQFGKCEGIIKAGDNVVAVYGWRPGPGFTNTMRIVLVGESGPDTVGLNEHL